MKRKWIIAIVIYGIWIAGSFLKDQVIINTALGAALGYLFTKSD